MRHLEDDEVRHLQFLINEGLELLAAFKAISDPMKRQEILAMTKAASAQEGVLPRDTQVGFSDGGMTIDRGRH